MLRIYHPDAPLRWQDRLADFFAGRAAPPLEPGVDYTLVHRTAARAARALRDELLALNLLGDEMVRVDTRWSVPPAATPESLGALVRRLRFTQVQPGGVRTRLGIRWVEFRPAAHGTTVLMRLTELPSPGLRSVLEANLAEGESADWTEVAVGQE